MEAYFNTSVGSTWWRWYFFAAGLAGQGPTNGMLRARVLREEVVLRDNLGRAWRDKPEDPDIEF